MLECISESLIINVCWGGGGGGHTEITLPPPQGSHPPTLNVARPVTPSSDLDGVYVGCPGVIYFAPLLHLAHHSHALTFGSLVTHLAQIHGFP